MEELGIKHKMLPVNGINIHVAEKGEGPVVLLLHGFPEFWYGWRYQLTELAQHGFRAVAPDLRGYGDSSVPPEMTSYTILHLVGDVVSLMDALEQPQVFVVGHDWGAILAWYLCLFRPDRIKALVNMSVPFIPRIGSIKPVQFLTAMYGDAYYICRFQESGIAETEIARLGIDSFLKKVFTYHKPEPFYIPKEGLGLPNEKITLPDWITEEEINYYVKNFEKTGFTGPLNYYRCLDLSWDLITPWSGAEITVPTKFIIGDHDMTYHFPGIQMYISLYGMKLFVPGLQDVAVLKGVGHFLHQERPKEITDHICDFIRKF
ncbi:Epoxide hydrolase [Rhynchospora pubera]|uniref:soluble epoxide hydrolase n=1 Tax=Rhynchospora pubera TaxID=906938 RepID=A0AAV8DMD1_9POAL|nr:Epoxide hydrolase [Rhynchospora pubera]